MCFDAVSKFRLDGTGSSRYVVPLEGFGTIVRLAVADTPHPAKDEIVRQLQGMPNNADVFDVEPAGPLGSAASEWRWRARGRVNVANEGEWAVPFIAEVVFRKLGRNLLAAGTIATLERSGEPEAYEPTYETDYDYLSDSD